MSLRTKLSLVILFDILATAVLVILFAILETDEHRRCPVIEKNNEAKFSPPTHPNSPA